MKTREFVARSRLPVGAEEAFAWHARPGAFERLSPPWAVPRVVSRTGPGVEPGTRLTLSIPAGPFRVAWVAEHGAVVPGREFNDRQVRGPFGSWAHRHRFEPAGPGACELEDRISWAPPFGALGALAATWLERDIARLFAYRHAVTRGDLERHAAVAGRPRMTVAITGAGGLVGSALCGFLEAGGHRVVRLVRREAAPGEISWDPIGGKLDPRALEGVDAIVHLAGEGIADRRWSAGRKARIRDSRVRGTDVIARNVAALDRKPRVFVSASAVGWYGASDAPALDEGQPAGRGFLADVVKAWEEAAAPAAAAGVRSVRARFGVILSARGGALAKMLPAFRAGAGGPVGSGRQGFPWVALDDVVGALYFALMDDRVSGPINVVAPQPVAQREFAAALGRVLRRPAFVPLPALAVRLLFGEMGVEALLSGAFVAPRVLVGAGFPFRFPDLDGALRFELGRLSAARS